MPEVKPCSAQITAIIATVSLMAIRRTGQGEHTIFKVSAESDSLLWVLQFTKKKAGWKHLLGVPQE